MASVGTRKRRSRAELELRVERIYRVPTPEEAARIAQALFRLLRSAPRHEPETLRPSARPG